MTTAAKFATAPTTGGVDVDVVVIGGGHNGLVTGCYLARSGLSVTVLEAAPVLGGMTAMGTPIPGAPEHQVNMCAIEPLMLRLSGIVEDLGLERHGYREEFVDPGFVGLFPDGSSLAFWRDPKRTADEIRRFSAADARAFLDFVEVFDAMLDLGLPIINMNPQRPRASDIAKLARSVARNRRQVKAVLSFAVAPFGQALAEYFTHPAVIDPLAVWASGAPTTDGTAIRLLPYSLFHRYGAGRPIGGMGSFVRALERALAAAGGTVRLSAPVAEIELAGERATGVVLESGETIGAKAVVSTCDPRTTLGRMLPAGTLSRAMEARVAHMPAFGENLTQIKVDLGFSGQPQLRRHEQWRDDGVDLRRPTTLLGGLDASSAACVASAAGRLPERVSIWAVIPTAVDASQAPAGQDVMYLWAWPLPLEPVDGWDGLSDAAGEMVVAQLSAIYEDVGELEIGRFVESPDALAERVRITNGCIEHVDCSPFRLGPLRPAQGLGGYRTPVDGLFLGGSGSHPGVGVHGIPGRLAAREVLRSLRPAGVRARVAAR